ncbi:2Fe-2S iron-sulfur cluster binding domain-containing protein [Muricauda sp. JGD-17]|uniref:2Fe-2S iron-sulfur cluster binding domain-containing protein n=1 Tax=Flagellimonas ochracea TaxID=2696472 RepID=A0A964WYY8_9FLAO|nr:(2Fe-2S)-binding protein [Allomuricauda ochracea]NAY93129.1 2Fe-2S iron-sulfur cluster binding domain-containing protein [Allomuricauda ochracea]
MKTIKINGEDHSLDVPGNVPLLWVLRDFLELTGTKYSCGIGVCGACTVLIDGKPVRSCSRSLDSLSNNNVVTIEGLGEEERLHELQKAWIENDVPQCGYCQSGQIMSALALLSVNADPSDADINQAMAGNLCRCGTYLRIRKAIKQAASMLRNTKNDISIKTIGNKGHKSLLP